MLLLLDTPKVLPQLHPGSCTPALLSGSGMVQEYLTYLLISPAVWLRVICWCRADQNPLTLPAADRYLDSRNLPNVMRVGE